MLFKVSFIIPLSLPKARLTCDDMTGHPYEPTIAASGIDSTIKIYSPDQKAQEDARRGINVLDPDNPTVSTVGGLRTCKRLDDSYRILSQNDVDRQGGMSDAFVTVRSPFPFLFPSFLSSDLCGLEVDVSNCI